MLRLVARTLQERSPTFDSLAVQVQGNKPYFSERREDLTGGLEVAQGAPLYIETNFNSNTIVEVCYALISKFGLPCGKFEALR